jgi:hypothetical protein
MAKRRPCGCSTCLILREIRKLQSIVLEALGEKYADESAELPKGNDPERGQIAVRALADRRLDSARRPK